MIDAISNSIPLVSADKTSAPIGPNSLVDVPGIAPTQKATNDFSAVVADVFDSSIEALRSGEAAATAGIQGKASMQTVVQSVMEAEQTLQVGIAVRNKVVEAYLEISRMAI
ncbi:MAG: flagellar hook-basal body complex protein FliE [Hyphomicrobiaceae bacterium]